MADLKELIWLLFLPAEFWHTTGSELEAPLPNRLVRNFDPALCEQVLYVTETHAEPVIEPHGVADDLRRKSMPTVLL